MRSTAFLLFFALALAGCAGNGPLLPSHGKSAMAPLSPVPTVVHGTGTVVASGPVLSVGGQSMNFTVGSDVTLVYAEMAWEDPVQDLDLGLASPDAGMTGTAQNFDHVAKGGMPGAPDSPHSLTIVGPAPGEWLATAFANGAASMVDYRIAVTLFHGETTVPDGYTALQ